MSRGAGINAGESLETRETWNILGESLESLGGKQNTGKCVGSLV